MKKQKNLWTYIVLTVLILLLSLPLVSMIGTSFKNSSEVLGNTSLFPKNPSLENYEYVINKTSFLQNILNSLLISACVTLACIIAAAFAGYALSRFRGKFFGFYKAILYLIQMLPLVLLLIPLFMIIRTVGLYDTLFSVMVSYTAINLPICIWMLKGFFDTLPFDIEESALIDGCNQFKTFFKIIIPVSAPGITSVGILSFIYAWNEYMLASIFIRSKGLMTLTVGLSQFVLQNEVDWGALMAASTLASVPAVLLLVFAQKYIVRGLTAGAVKG